MLVAILAPHPRCRVPLDVLTNRLPKVWAAGQVRTQPDKVLCWADTPRPELIREGVAVLVGQPADRLFRLWIAECCGNVRYPIRYWEAFVSQWTLAAATGRSSTLTALPRSFSRRGIVSSRPSTCPDRVAGGARLANIPGLLDGHIDALDESINAHDLRDNRFLFRGHLSKETASNSSPPESMTHRVLCSGNDAGCVKSSALRRDELFLGFSQTHDYVVSR
jgi:hypothetical protein